MSFQNRCRLKSLLHRVRSSFQRKSEKVHRAVDEPVKRQLSLVPNTSRSIAPSDPSSDSKSIFDRNVKALDPNVTVDLRAVWKLRGYDVLDFLGGGSYSSVVSMKDMTDRKFALKMIDYLKSRKDSEGQFFGKREVSIVGSLTHPNLVGAQKTYNIQNTFFMEMKLACGNLSSHMKKRGGSYCEAGARKLVTQIGSALCYMHSVDIVHKDLKPENILVYKENDQFVYKISDFGFAKRVKNGCLDNERCGTPGYCAPEMYGTEEFNPRLTDSFAFGVVLYYVLVGQIPWDSALEVLRSVDMMSYQMYVKWVEPSKRYVLLSDSCEEALHSLVARDASRRSSVKQFMECAWIRDVNTTKRNTSEEKHQESEGADKCTEKDNKKIELISPTCLPLKDAAGKPTENQTVNEKTRDQPLKTIKTTTTSTITFSTKKSKASEKITKTTLTFTITSIKTVKLT